MNDDWLGKDDEALTGFPWRGGSQRETTGILLWNKPFICQMPDGEEVCFNRSPTPSCTCKIVCRIKH